nr:hypothetical protein [uncultured Marinifilum sp.]
MKDICVPIPFTKGSNLAEIEIKIEGRKRKIQYRIESFRWELKDNSDNAKNYPKGESLLKIKNLKQAIANYDNNWELIQIYAPSKVSKFIQVLFRKK